MKTIIAARKVALCMVLILGIILGGPGCRQKAEQQAQTPPLELTLAMQNGLSSGLIAVADEKLVNQIPRNEITPVAVPPAKQAEAVVAGEVDAVSVFDRYAFVASTGLGENAVSWDSENNIDYQWLLAARESSTESPEAIKRLLKALIKAEDFMLTNEDEAKSIIARKWDYRHEYIRHAWSQTRLFVSFNQSIITSLQNYTRWQMGRQGKTGDFPDILSYLYTGALDEIDPKLVTIYR